MLPPDAQRERGRSRCVHPMPISTDIHSMRSLPDCRRCDCCWCPQYFSLSFLREFCGTKLKTLPLHVARKKIPTTNAAGERTTPSEPNGIKLELFIFDTFPHAQRLVALQVRARALGWSCTACCAHRTHARGTSWQKHLDGHVNEGPAVPSNRFRAKKNSRRSRIRQAPRRTRPTQHASSSTRWASLDCVLLGARFARPQRSRRRDPHRQKWRSRSPPC